MPTHTENQWPTLARLTNMEETERRRVLRFHRETGPGFANDRPLRQDLDRELGRLGRLELQAEAANGESQESALAEIAAVNTEFRDLIQESPAFAHYLDAYLYFKIRFAAGRLKNPCTHHHARVTSPDGRPQWNERPVGLPSPPPCEGPTAREVNEDVERFLGLGRSRLVDDALEFLDDYVAEDDETRKFDLWLRGLLPTSEGDDRFRSLAHGLYIWARQHYQFYLEIEGRQGRAHDIALWRNSPREEGAWHARNPLSARCGVTDLYWLARILRAEISPRGVVEYADRSWLYYLPSLSPDDYAKQEILRMEDVLRSVFAYACEMIQNAVEMAEYCEKKDAQPDEYSPRASGSDDWRAVQDREIEEIGKHRRERLLTEEPRGVHATHQRQPHGVSGNYWSRRIRTGETEENLIGVALSGGGIRSATFALGVLQRLKDLDLLRRVDYLSTVSGGGYIGAWLLGNVRRTRYWLSKMTSWEEAIGHLRNYSKYLAPQSGFLSADSWVVWGTWVRNASLIQLTAAAWLWALLVLALVVKAIFEWAGGEPVREAMHVFLAAGFVVLAAVIGLNLRRPKPHPPTQHRLVVLLAWFGSFLTAALLWSTTSQKQDYSVILQTEFYAWLPYLGPSLLLSMLILALVSGTREAKRRTQAEAKPWVKFLGSAGVALLSAGVIYLALCAVRYVFGVWAALDKAYYSWYAYVFGAPMVLVGVTLSVVVFIGLVGATSADWRREWWTRYGSWLAIYGAGFLALALTAVFGHIWLSALFNFGETFLGKTVKWSAVAGWFGSVIAGLLAGNSNKTKGNGGGSSPVLEWVAKIGGVLFIAGSVLILSAVLHFLLVQIWLSGPSRWWLDLNLLMPPKSWSLLITLGALVGLGFLFSWRFNLNIFGLNQFYRNRLVRCYLGGTRWTPGMRQPDRFTAFDEYDDLNLTDLRHDAPQYKDDHFRGPFPIVNCALNLGGSSDLTVKTRQSTAFTLTPQSAGAARAKIGYAPVEATHGFSGGVSLGEAISISGAAASPNMGYNTNPLVAVLLTMFNVRLAWWFPNPGRKKWKNSSSPVSILYLVEEFLGLADETSDYVNVSDGGHFENLAIYELVRRRAKVIIVSDAECDPDLSFGSLGNVIRICETDFGAKIDIDVASIRKQENGKSRAHCAVGQIAYSNGSLGYLVYLKASITGDEDTDVEQYREVHLDFPHQSTSDQFFTEDQFESYRRLGYHVATLAFRDAESGSNLVDTASKLYDVWAPAGFNSEAFVNHAANLDKLWERFRTSDDLRPLLQELMADRPGPPCPVPPSHEELALCLELVQLMENVMIDLRLDDFWDHPDNRGWAMLFIMWAKSPIFRAAWRQIHHTFGIRFEYFCQQRLGLEKDHPVVRV